MCIRENNTKNNVFMSNNHRKLYRKASNMLIIIKYYNESCRLTMELGQGFQSKNPLGSYLQRPKLRAMGKFADRGTQNDGIIKREKKDKRY